MILLLGHIILLSFSNIIIDYLIYEWVSDYRSEERTIFIFLVLQLVGVSWDFFEHPAIISLLVVSFYLLQATYSIVCSDSSYKS